MSENTEAEVPAEEKTFGFNANEIVLARREARRAANRVYGEAIGRINGPIYTAKRAVHSLFGECSTEAASLSDLLEVLYKEKRRAALDEAQETRDRAYTKAQDDFDTAIGDDLFVRFVIEDDDIDSSAVSLIFESAPHTFASLKNLAEYHQWCTAFEHIAERAVRAGALPDDKVTLTRQCSRHAVPSHYGAKRGEVWEMEFQVPAFVRTVDDGGNALDLGEIIFVSGVPAYRKVADAPVQD